VVFFAVVPEGLRVLREIDEGGQSVLLDVRQTQSVTKG